MFCRKMLVCVCVCTSGCVCVHMSVRRSFWEGADHSQAGGSALRTSREHFQQSPSVYGGSETHSREMEALGF